MKQTKVCFYSISTHLGGAERSLLDLLSLLKRQDNFDFEVLLPQSEGPLLVEFGKLGIKYSTIQMPQPFLKMSRGTPIASAIRFIASIPSMFLYLRRVNHYFLENHFDYIHTTGIKCHILSIFAARSGIKIVWHLRDIFAPGLTKTLLRYEYKLFQKRIKLIGNSLATANSFGNDFPISVIHNGIDENKFNQNQNRDFHTELGLPKDAQIVGVLGAIARWKGQKEFIQMAKLVSQELENVFFVVIGDQIYDTTGDQGYLAELKDLVEVLDLQKKVFFVGFRVDSSRSLNGLTVLVHSSIRPEPFGRVIIESQACGVPVVASAAGGVLEILHDNQDGLLYEPGNVPGMAKAVIKILRDPDLRKKVTEAGSKNVSENFTLNSHLQKVLAVYASF